MSARETSEEGAPAHPAAGGIGARVSAAWGTARQRTSALAAVTRKGARVVWDSPAPMRLRTLTIAARHAPWSGAAVIAGGAVITTLFILRLDRIVFIPNHGSIYLPVIAFIAYYWDLWLGAIAALIDLVCIYFFFAPPTVGMKPLNTTSFAQLVTNGAVIAFTLAVVQLAVSRRELAEREASRFASLNSVGLALAGELNEERLLRLIAQTACDLTGAGFAAFTLRPLDAMGHPLTPSRGDLFHLAAVVGVTADEERRLQHMALGGEGLLAPIFRYGKSVRVADAAAAYEREPATSGVPGSARARREAARRLAQDYARGAAQSADLRSLGAPRGHPVVRSFLGAPLLDRQGEVRGGLLLGHHEPDRFTAEDERLLLGLAAQAATALENARLYRAAQSQAQELDVIFESIADGVSLVDARGQTIRENGAARTLRDALAATGADAAPMPAGHAGQPPVLTVAQVAGETREYLVSTTRVNDGAPAPADGATPDGAVTAVTADLGVEQPSAVVVWHDVTEAQQLTAERRARAETDARRALLQLVIDELPSGVYLVYGPEARLALANRTAFDLWGAVWPVGQPMSEFLREQGTRVLRPDGQPMPLEELATLRAAQSGEAVRHHQELIARPDGVSLPILFNAVTISPDLLRGLGPGDDTASAIGEGYTVLVVLQDMTPLKEAERIKDEFIAMAAHELRTPMAAVRGYAEMLERGARAGQGAALEEWQREALDSIDVATIRLVDLTNDLLDVSRLQADRMELRIEPHDLVALVKRVARRYQVTSGKHRISVHAAQEYVVARVDAPRMEQVVGNLLSNAIKYSPEGGEVVVSVEADEAREVARASVRDSGVGIPEQEQSQVFARFSRASNARELGIGGTGLGLYLCRELLAHMDGRIWFESQVGNGTSVYFEVPLVSEGDEEAG
ncbi:MAG TPA: ATP-binding protein [Ktedonobacterales bacterium]